MPLVADLVTLSCLILTTASWERGRYSHFTDEATRTQTGWVTVLRSHGSWGWSLGPHPCLTLDTSSSPPCFATQFLQEAHPSSRKLLHHELQGREGERVKGALGKRSRDCLWGLVLPRNRKLGNLWKVDLEFSLEQWTLKKILELFWTSYFTGWAGEHVASISGRLA